MDYEQLDKKLNAEILENKRLREALEHLIKMEEYGEFTEGPYIGDEVVRVCKQALEFTS